MLNCANPKVKNCKALPAGQEGHGGGRGRRSNGIARRIPARRSDRPPYGTIMRILILPGLLLSILAGCATRPAITASEVGTMPPPGGFRIVGVGAAQSSLETALAAKLEANGFAADAKGRMLVQISQSEPPARTGLTTAPPADAQWLIEPTRAKSQRIKRLVVTVTDGATGEEIYRAYGTERYRPVKPGDGEALQEAVLALFP